MRRNSFNRKLRRALAASLGAFAFASSAYVTKAAEDIKSKRQMARDMLKFLSELNNAEVNSFLDTSETTLNKAIDKINNQLKQINGKTLKIVKNGRYGPKKVGLSGRYDVYLGLDKTRFAIPAVLLCDNLYEHNNVNPLRQRKYYRLCGRSELTNKGMPFIVDLLGATPKTYRKRINRWARRTWEEARKDIENRFKIDEQKEKYLEKLAAEKERNQNNNNYSSYFSSSGSNNYNNPISSFNPAFNPAVGLASMSVALPMVTNMIPTTAPANIQTPATQITAGPNVVSPNGVTTPVGPLAQGNMTTGQTQLSTNGSVQTMHQTGNMSNQANADGKTTHLLNHNEDGTLVPTR